MPSGRTGRGKKLKIPETVIAWHFSDLTRIENKPQDELSNLYWPNDNSTRNCQISWKCYEWSIGEINIFKETWKNIWLQVGWSRPKLKLVFNFF